MRDGIVVACEMLLLSRGNPCARRRWRGIDRGRSPAQCSSHVQQTVVHLISRKSICVRDIWRLVLAHCQTMDQLIPTVLEKAAHFRQIVLVGGGIHGACAPFSSLLPGKRVARQESRHVVNFPVQSFISGIVKAVVRPLAYVVVFIVVCGSLVLVPIAAIDVVNITLLIVAGAARRIVLAASSSTRARRVIRIVI